MLRSLFFIFFIGTISFSASAQQYPHTAVPAKVKKLYDEAGVYINQRKFAEAEKNLLKAIEKEPNYWEAVIRLATISKNLANHEKAAQYFERAIEIKPDDPRNASAYFTVAEHCYKAGDYQKAHEYSSSGLKLENLTSKFRSELDRLHQGIAFSLVAIQNPVSIRSSELPDPVNQYQLQYFPVISADGQSLVFTARQTNDRNSDENIMITHLRPDGSWAIPESISPVINTDFNEGTCTISGDGRTLIFTSCVGRDGFGSCDLYITYKQGEKWAKPQNLGAQINSKYWESQPALSPDGRTLYWVSDRPGGLGKTDIWYSTKDKTGKWTAAKNLGAPVNTPFDELSPFIHFNQKTLFFASNGHLGMGGYDLFATEKLENGWSTPQNLGYPLNDHHDQMALVVDIEGSKGYYSKDTKREGASFSKIHQVEFDSLRIAIPKVHYVKGKVLDKETSTPLRATIELFDLKTATPIYITQTDSISGEYLFTLNEEGEFGMNVSKRGYLPESLSFLFEKKESKENSIIYLSKAKQGGSFTLRNIYFDFNESSLKSESETELVLLLEFLNQNPQASILIEGHTDNIGNEQYNLNLSRIRAQSVRDYLIRKGIPSQRINTIGFGDTKPLAPNNTEANQALNRRIEIKIVRL